MGEWGFSSWEPFIIIAVSWWLVTGDDVDVCRRAPIRDEKH